MATHNVVARPTIAPATTIFKYSYSKAAGFQNPSKLNIPRTTVVTASRRSSVQVSALNNSSSNYMVPLDYASTGITRPLAEIFRDLNKRIPDNIIVKQPDDDAVKSSFIPWYHANRMLSFYAPGWCGEIRDVIFSDSGSVTVVYRVTVRGSDGEAHREATGTVLAAASGQSIDPVAAAEEIAFCKACARFGLGLYLYHED